MYGMSELTEESAMYQLHGNMSGASSFWGYDGDGYIIERGHMVRVSGLPGWHEVVRFDGNGGIVVQSHDCRQRTVKTSDVTLS